MCWRLLCKWILVFHRTIPWNHTYVEWSTLQLVFCWPLWPRYMASAWSRPFWPLQWQTEYRWRLQLQLKCFVWTPSQHTVRHEIDWHDVVSCHPYLLHLYFHNTIMILPDSLYDDKWWSFITLHKLTTVEYIPCLDKRCGCCNVKKLYLSFIIGSLELVKRNIREFF